MTPVRPMAQRAAEVLRAQEAVTYSVRVAPDKALVVALELNRDKCRQSKAA